jgi:probable HAF family extracellular repeat protein
MRLSHSLSLSLLTGISVFSLNVYATPSVVNTGVLSSNFSFTSAVDNSGTFVVGSGATAESFIWSLGTGITEIFPGAGFSTVGRVHGISGDGTIVVGQGSFGSYDRALMWTSGTGVVPLGTLGGFVSIAYSISSDGNVIVGTSDTMNSYEAFRWTSGTGMVGLGTLGGSNSDARATNSDGSVIVGGSDTGSATNAFMWTSGTGMVNLGTLSGGTTSTAYGISDDGSVVVGTSENSSLTNEAFRWTSGTGMMGLGFLSGWTTSEARGISGNGQVIVGESGPEAFVWTATNGMQSLNTILTNAGVDTSAWTFEGARDANYDGTVVVGYGQYSGIYQGYVANIGNNIGVTTLVELGNSIIPTTTPAQQTFTLVTDSISQSLLIARNALTTYFPDLNTEISDSFSLSLPASPADIAPAAGDDDISSFHHRGYKRMALFSTGTVGIGQNNEFSNYTLNGSLGGLIELNDGTALGIGIINSYDEQETRLGGESVLKASGLTLLGSYESLSGISFYSSMALVDLDVETARNYLNGAGINTSKGSTDGLGLGLSVKAGYELTDKIYDWSIIPYTEWEWSYNSLDAYTENGGGFPVTVGKQSSHNVNGKIGVEASHLYNDTLTIRGRTAIGHRFTDKGQVRVSSAVINQTLQAADDDKTWLELGTNLNYKMSDDMTISGDLSGRSGETSSPAIQATIGLVWNWN